MTAPHTTVPHTPSQPTSLAHSLWFWVHVFSVFCLAVLMVRGDKIVQLRTQRAVNSQMRKAVASSTAAVDDNTSSAERRQVLAAYVFFGLVAVISWWQVWRTVLRPRLASFAHRQSRRSRTND